MADWQYQGIIDRIIDGDTCVVDLDMGMRVWQKQVHIRIAGINAPELTTDAGKIAKAFIEALLPIGTIVTIVSHQFDKYGRLLASVDWDSNDWASVMLTSGNAIPY